MRRRNQNPHHPGGGNRSHGGHNRNRRYGGGGGGGRSNYSSGPDGQGDHVNAARVRRHATTQREKYYNMARDALSSGDRVQAEYYFQHVEHFTRVLSELPPEEQRQQRSYYNNNNPGQRDQYAQSQPEGETAAGDAPQDNGNGQDYDREDMPAPAASALPAFITGGRGRPQAAPVQQQAPDEE